MLEVGDGLGNKCVRSAVHELSVGICKYDNRFKPVETLQMHDEALFHSEDL